MNPLSPKAARTGDLRKLFEPAKIALDKTPVLRDVFERLAAACPESLREVCPTPCTAILNSLTVGSVWDLIENFEDGICGIFYSPDWDTRLIVGFDRRLALSLTDAVFGGDGTESVSGISRPYSTIEARTAKQSIQLLTAELAELVSTFDRTQLVFERLETKLDFSTIGVPDAPAVLAQFLLQVYDSGGLLFVIMPQSALMPFRKKLERASSLEPAHRDAAWSTRLLDEVAQVEMQLDAVIDGPDLTMQDVTSFHVGQTLPLEVGVGSLLSLESSATPLFKCQIGQSDGKFTVKIVEQAPARADLLSRLASTSRPPAE